MLSAEELSRYRGGGLTHVFVSRIFQECQTYRNVNTGQSEIDYKSYLDFVLATTYKGTTEVTPAEPHAHARRPTLRTHAYCPECPARPSPRTPRALRPPSFLHPPPPRVP